MENKRDTVLLLPDGRIAQDRKEAKELLGIGKYTFKRLFDNRDIKLVNKNLISTSDEQRAKNQL